MNKKYIFLDIDGVLATHKEYSAKKSSKRYLTEFNVYPYNEKCVNILNKILEKTDAEIILSSDWSLTFDMEQMNKIFKHNGIIKSPIDYVKQYSLELSTNEETEETNRGYSINEYLVDHPEVTDYVIIDDLDITNYNEIWNKNINIDYSKFVHCSRGDYEGIKQTGVKEKILKILKKSN